MNVRCVTVLKVAGLVGKSPVVTAMAGIVGYGRCNCGDLHEELYCLDRPQWCMEAASITGTGCRGAKFLMMHTARLRAATVRRWK